MSGVNKVILIGRLGRDPEVKTKKDGSGCIATFSMATSFKFKDKHTGELQDRTEWHNIVCFDKLGDIAGQYLKKGSNVYIEGSLQTDKYADKDGGKDRYSTKIKALSLQFLDKKDDASQNNTHAGNATTEALHGNNGAQNYSNQNHSNENNDIPF